MEGGGGCWAGEEKESPKERTTQFRIACLPLISPRSERKWETLGLAGALFSEHVVPPFGTPGSGLKRWTGAVLKFYRL